MKTFVVIGIVLGVAWIGGPQQASLVERDLLTGGTPDCTYRTSTYPLTCPGNCDENWRRIDDRQNPDQLDTLSDCQELDEDCNEQIHSLQNPGVGVCNPGPTPFSNNPSHLPKGYSNPTE